MAAVFLRETFEDAQCFPDIFGLGPINKARAPAVIPSVLAAGGAMQIQQQLQAISLAFI